MRVGWLLLLTACGRVHFDGLAPDDATTDGSRDARTLPANVYGYWTFDEGSGGTAVDSTGNAPSLSLMRATWTTGITGGAVRGDGTNQYLVSTTALDLSSTSAVTISLWLRYNPGGPGPFNNVFETSADFNFTDIGLGMFVDDTNDCTTPGMGLGLRGDVGGSAGCYSPPSAGQWHHVVAVYDKTQPGCCETQLYLDGVAQTPMPKANSDNSNNFGAATLFLLTRGGVGAFAAAELDELAIFRRALTPAEIAAF